MKVENNRKCPALEESRRRNLLRVKLLQKSLPNFLTDTPYNANSLFPDAVKFEKCVCLCVRYRQV